jgi:hypothetical protein
VLLSAPTAGLRPQVTDVFEYPATVAVNCVVCWAYKVAVAGLTEMVALAGSRRSEEARIKVARTRNRSLGIALVLTAPHLVIWRTTETYKTFITASALRTGRILLEHSLISSWRTTLRLSWNWCVNQQFFVCALTNWLDKCPAAQ